MYNKLALFLIVLSGLFFLSSCSNVQYKPPTYNKTARIFNNYEANYSFQVPEGYQLISLHSKFKFPQELDKFSKPILNNFPPDLILLVNKEHFIFWLLKDSTVPGSYQNGLDMLDFDNAEVRDNYRHIFNEAFEKKGFGRFDTVEKDGDYLIGGKSFHSNLFDGNLEVALTFYNKYNGINTEKNRMLILGSFSFPVSKEKGLKDFRKFCKEIQLGKITDEERHLKTNQ